MSIDILQDKNRICIKHTRAENLRAAGGRRGTTEEGRERTSVANRRVRRERRATRSEIVQDRWSRRMSGGEVVSGRDGGWYGGVAQRITEG